MGKFKFFISFEIMNGRNFAFAVFNRKASEFKVVSDVINGA